MHCSSSDTVSGASTTSVSPPALRTNICMQLRGRRGRFRPAVAHFNGQRSLFRGRTPRQLVWLVQPPRHSVGEADSGRAVRCERPIVVGRSTAASHRCQCPSASSCAGWQWSCCSGMCGASSTTCATIFRRHFRQNAISTSGTCSTITRARCTRRAESRFATRQSWGRTTPTLKASHRTRMRLSTSLQTSPAGRGSPCTCTFGACATRPGVARA